MESLIVNCLFLFFVFVTVVVGVLGLIKRSKFKRNADLIAGVVKYRTWDRKFKGNSRKPESYTVERTVVGYQYNGVDYESDISVALNKGDKVEIYVYRANPEKNNL